MKDSSLIIDIDEYKKGIAGYIPAHSCLVHSYSARKADRVFIKVLKSKKYNNVILMAGGSASGKTEFVHSHLFDEKAVIFDSTLSTIEGAEVKLRNIKRLGLKAEIVLVIPDNLYRAYVAFLNRERKIENSVFVKTHCGCRKTVLFVAKTYFNVKIRLVRSLYIDGQMKYRDIMYKDREELVAFLEKIQISQSTLLKIMHEKFKA